MFQHFTDPARRTIVLAQEEARLLKHNYIGTEHLLLGILHQNSLQELLPTGLALETTRQQVIELIGEGSSTPPGHIPFTPRAKKALELSTRKADDDDMFRVHPPHLMLGLILLTELDDAAAAGHILRRLSINAEDIKDSMTGAIGQLPKRLITEPSSQQEPDPDLQEKLGNKDFISWYTTTGKKRFSPSRPVSKLYRCLIEQSDP